MYSCYVCCLQCPGMKELYQVWTYRACFYICFSIAMFAYKVTTTTGIMLVVIGVILLFARWRGEAQPILDDPWAKIADLQDENDIEDSDDEDDDEGPKVELTTPKKKGRRMK